MANHAVIRTDLMTGTDVAADLRAIRYMGADGQTATDIDNGNVVELVALEDAEREVWVAKTPAANAKDVVIVANPEMLYDERKRSLKDYYTEAGRVARAYVPHSNDIFSVTAEALDGTPEKGKFVSVQAGTKLKVGSSATNAFGKIERVEVVGKLTYYVIRIL